MTRTSSISGTLLNRQRSPVRVAAASSLSAAFLAPLTRTVPSQRRAALDRNASGATAARGRYSQWNGRGVSHALISPPASDGPSRRRRSRRGSAAAPAAATPARRKVGALGKPDSSARSASRRASWAFSRSISDAMSAVSAITTTLSGRTWRKPPTMAKRLLLAALADAQLARRRASRAAARGAGRTPSSPSMPGTMTISTSSA